MIMNENEISIFNIGDNREAMNAAMFSKGVDKNLFDPKLQNLADTDTFIIRPVPYYANPLNSKVTKSFYVFQDSIGFFFFDSRTTFNRPAENYYEFCEPSDLWLKCRNAKDKTINDKTDLLSRQTSNYSYVLIVNYPKKPELNGKILPMALPMEMVKAMSVMSNPTKEQIAIGAVPTQPYDLINGKNFTCSITGHMQGNTLMRKWAVVPDQFGSPMKLPIGANGSVIPITESSQDVVLNYFKEYQTEDLYEKYGYKEPTVDTKRRMRDYLMSVVADVPALYEIAKNYFKDVLDTVAATDMNAMPLPPVDGTGVSMGQVNGNAMQQVQGVPPVQQVQNVPPVQQVQNVPPVQQVQQVQQVQNVPPVQQVQQVQNVQQVQEVQEVQNVQPVQEGNTAVNGLNLP